MADGYNTDSFRPLVAEVFFVDTSPTGEERGRIRIPTQDYLQEIEVEEFTTGGWKGKLRFFDAESDFLVGLVLSTGPNKRFDFRFGFDDDSFKPWHYGSLVEYTPDFRPDGFELEVEVVSAPLVASSIRKGFKDGSPIQYREGMTATQIFKDIAQKEGWEVVSDGGPTYEESFGAIKHPFNESELSPHAFILNRLVPEAVNKNGQGFVYSHRKDRRVYFHSLDFQPIISKVRREYVFGAMKDGVCEVISFKPCDNVLGAMLSGSGTAKHEAPDSLAGSKVNVQGEKLKGTPEITLTDKGGAVWLDATPNAVGSAPHKFSIPFTRDPEDQKRRAAARWSLLQQQAYKANLVVMGTHAALPADMIRVDYLRKDKSPHYLGGVFQILKLTHNFGKGDGFKSTMELCRQGTGFKEAVAGAQQNAPAPKQEKLQTGPTVNPAPEPQNYGNSSRPVNLPLGV